MNVLNENTISLPTLLTKIVNSSTESNGLITAMAESINTLQEILLRIELSLNPDNEVEEEVPEEEVPEEQEEEAQQEG